MRLPHGRHAQAVALVFASFLAEGPGDAAPTRKPAHVARVVTKPAPRSLAASSDGATKRQAWAAALSSVSVRNRNTGAEARVKIYTADGAIDKDQVRAFVNVVSSRSVANGDYSTTPVEPLDLRLVQLTMRAVYHFAPNGPSGQVIVVSATRKGARGHHGDGTAIDFQIEGVSAASLAAFLRTMPRAGVGIYTHPRTQYVHLDVRDHSYHWVDGSPPNVTWREQLLADPNQGVRDASYKPAMDLPESSEAR